MAKLQKNRGVSGVKQRGRTSLAVKLQAHFPDELHTAWDEMILSGKWPMLVRDERCVSTNGLKVMAHPTRQPSEEHIMQAMRDLRNRQYGMAPQMIHVKEEKEHYVNVTLELPEVTDLNETQKQLIRQALGVKQPTYALPEASSEFDDMDVTDADFEMVPSEGDKDE